MKFKVGDKIVPKNGEWACGNADGTDYAIITKVITYPTSSYYHYDLYKDGKKVDWCGGCQNDTNSKLMEKTTEDLQKGDVIVSENGVERTVIETLGDIIFTTYQNNNMNEAQIWTTGKLKEFGYTIKQSEPKPTEITMQQIADEFGVDVSKLKIKKG